jgi:putative endonuclease
MTSNFGLKETKVFGNQSEMTVAHYLEQQGFTILEQNYKKFFGEVDIIARKGSIVTFVEVKARKKNGALMHELVTPSKQRKIGLVARSFISRHMQDQDVTYRFDVALVQGVSQDQKITYIANAYVVSEY